MRSVKGAAAAAACACVRALCVYRSKAARAKYTDREQVRGSAVCAALPRAAPNGEDQMSREVCSREYAARSARVPRCAFFAPRKRYRVQSAKHAAGQA